VSVKSTLNYLGLLHSIFDYALAEGWVAGRHGAGTFVVAVPAAPRPGADVAPPSRRRAALVHGAPSAAGAECAEPPRGGGPAPISTENEGVPYSSSPLTGEPVIGEPAGPVEMEARSE